MAIPSYLFSGVLNTSNSHRTLKQISFSLAFFGFLLGFLVGYGVLTADEQGRVNLLFLLMLFAFLPVFGLILSLVLLLRGGGKGLAGWILELPILPQRLSAEILNLGVSGSRQSWLFYQTQLLTLSFALGGLLVYLFLLLGSDISFVWRSTLLQASDLLPVLKLLAAPWWFWPEAQASLELLQQTQDFRLSAQSNNVPVLGQWWKYIFAAQCTYNLLPRSLMLMFAKSRYLQATKVQSILSAQNPHSRNLLNAVHDNPGLAPVVGSITGPYILLDWADSPEFCRSYISGFIGTPLAVCAVQPLTLATAVEVDGSHRATVVLVKSWEPPLGELSDYLSSLSRSQQNYILPLDWGESEVKPIRARHLDEWRRFCATLSDWQLLQLDASS